MAAVTLYFKTTCKLSSKLARTPCGQHDLQQELAGIRTFFKAVMRHIC